MNGYFNMDEIDRLIAAANMEAADYESNYFNLHSANGSSYTPVYLFSTRHGFHLLGLDDSPRTRELVAESRRLYSDFCDPVVMASGFQEAIESLAGYGEKNEKENLGIAAYLYCRATKTWRLLQEQLKQVPDINLKPHFFIIQYHRTSTLRPAAILDERNFIPAKEAVDFVANVIADDRVKHPEYFYD